MTRSPSRALRRPLFLGGLALAAGAAVFLLLGNPRTDTAAPTPDAPPQVSVAAPTVRPIVEWDDYTGRFEAIESVDVRARVSGYLTRIAFEDGALVEAGDLLFEIDPRPFEAELAAARALEASAVAALDTARIEYERGARLSERQAISAEEADRRRRALRQAEAGLAAAKARTTRAALDLEFTNITAPVAGRVSDNFVSEGNLIIGGAQGGTLLTTLVSQDPIHFEFTASEADYLKYTRLYRTGERVSSREAPNPVRLRLLDEEAFIHQGRMVFVDNQLDPSTGTIRGRALFDNPDGVFTPGMFAKAQLVGSGEYEAILIPDRAVQTDQSTKFVWTVSEAGTAERTPVVLGPLHEGERIVRQGLTAGSQIIISGTQFVRPGGEVAIRRDERLADAQGGE